MKSLESLNHEIKKITIENFKSFGSEPTTINFDFNGTVLINGKNGAGKTSCFDALVWVLYGYTKLKADNVTNKIVGGNTKVELEFSENNKDYVITRYRKHSTHKNNVYIFENNENITLKNQVDNQELIQSIIGIEPKAFLSSIMLSTETYNQFLRETNISRLQIFESVFSLKEINTFSKLNKQKIKELERQIQDKDNEAKSLSSFISADSATIKTYRDSYLSTSKKIDGQILELENENIELNSKLNSYNNKNYDECLSEYIEYQDKLREYNDSKQKLDYIKEKLEYNVKQYDEILQKVLEYQDTIDTISADILKEQLQNNLKKNELDSKRDKCINKVLSLKELKAQYESDILKITSSQKILSDKKSLSEDKILKINNNICPVCGNHIDSEHSASVIKEEQKSIDSINIEISKLESEKSTLDKLNSSNNSELDKLNIEISNIDKELSNLSIKYTIQEVKELAEKLKDANANINEAKFDKELKELQIKELKDKLKDYSEVSKPQYSGLNIDDINSEKQNIVTYKAKIESNLSLIENLKSTKELAFDKQYVEKMLSTIKDRQQSLNSLNSDVYNLKKEYSKYVVLEDILSNGDKGFKKYFINKTVGLFNEKLNTFLPFFFSDDIEITFDRDLNDTIIYRGKDTDFEELSSGEKRRCELCIVFALYYMVQSLFGCGTNLLVIDELIDTALDSEGIIASKRIIDNIAKNSSVFVVSHREELKDMFDKVMNVYKDGDGFTKIKGSV